MHELSSSRRWRLPAGPGRIAAAVGACLCAGQLLVASAISADTASAPRPASVGAPPTVSGRALELAPADRRPAGASRQATRPLPRSIVASRAAAARKAAALRAAARKAAARARYGSRVIAVAAGYTGRPYVFGAAGPRAYDCSGFTQSVFRRFGINLPHKADAQQRYGRSVSRSQARPGDLIFFRSGSYAYHVGIYAGGGYMYDAPRPGRSIGRHKIWSQRYTVRRLIG